MRCIPSLLLFNDLKKKTTVVLLSLAISLSSCVTTELLQQGKTKFYTSNDLKNIVVIAYPGQLMDIKAFEGSVVKSLKSKNLAVTSAYDVFKNETSIPEDAISIRKAIKDKGFDAKALSSPETALGGILGAL